ncbi:MAG TPA: zinc dependent phospholipase C family protein [Candidatus Nitrosocosmicus sp.]|nr:zinc dependent phospholipase C family protein [Candidatus Nitrosocosmicus sp.]
MLSDTHRLIAHNVFKVLQSELNIDVDYDSLRHGSVAPDIYPTMMFMSHSMKGSIGLVHEYIDSLYNNAVPDDRKGVEKFSYRLGVLVHFTSDYFCKAHNEKRYNNLVLHYLYERKLKRHFDKHIRNYKPFVGLIKPGDWGVAGSIKDFIREKHNEYCGLERSMSNDVMYSIGVSAIAVLNIVAHCVKNTNGGHLRKIA